ncbi:MAG TPA: LysR family transcriptional regulator [Gammaproteobacteria bacterium]
MTRRPVYYSQNRLQQLRGFVFTAEFGSISKAAEHMELTQPSVSLQVQALEKELGAMLFERKGRRIMLTPAGKQLLEIAAPLVRGIENLKTDFEAHCEDLESGELNIASGESTLLYLLPDFVARFGRQYPQVRLHFHNVTGRDGMEMLRSDDVDFAVGSMQEVPDDIRYVPVFSYPNYLITPLDHPLSYVETITLKDISEYGLILPPRHLTTWRIIESAFRRQGLPLNVKLEAGGWEVIKKYVELGLGISIVSGICLKPWDRLFRFALRDAFPERSYGVVMRRGKFLSPQAKRFMRLLQPDIFEHKVS